jgi:site-specific DNA recombinase
MATRRRKPVDDTPTSAVLYFRVSTPGQVEHGVSLDAQGAACRAHAARLGLPVIAEHRDEGISGRLGHEERPGLAAVLATVRDNPSACVIVYSLSRLARSQRMVWELLDEQGAHRLRVVSASEPFDTTTAMGRAMLGMLATFAQLESDLASERTRDALAYVRTQGTQLGAPSMLELPGPVDAESGLRNLDPAKVALVTEVQAVARETGLSLRKLVGELDRRGIKSAKGARWHPRTLRVALGLRLLHTPGGE